MTFPSDDLVAHAKHINERYTPAQVAPAGAPDQSGPQLRLDDPC